MDKDRERPPRAIWFDLDNTLYDHRRASRAAMAELHRRYGLAARGVAVEAMSRIYFEVNQRLWLKLATREIDVPTIRAQRFAELWERLGLGVPGADAARALGREYLDIYLTFNYAVAGAEETLAGLAPRLPLGLLTNGFTDIQRPKIRRLGWEKYFKWLAVAEELGCFKPDPEIFRRICALSACAPGDILYVGDSPVEDIIPAREAGLRTVWLRREGPETARWAAAARADYEVGEITEVVGVISGLAD